ncbi:hypothetical protein [Neorhodopirellula pilleata]|uniref:SLA1 homology domain-containing protein n=1 Tax=Neorhodopirellula pilleata TaxID=2714738 RepID=A0A5C6AQ70_9BACT|nr:hypothetical protein [Neorhodopirellula pilleata]TWU01591.1 hypothetical protein Pla100_13260 [Neorhodopirellula pilleata]
MNRPFFFLLTSWVLTLWLTCQTAVAQPRTWTSRAGGATIEGELIAANDSTVVLKRKHSGRLAAVELAELSPQDREFVRERVVKGDSGSNDPEHMQTWTSRDGLKMQAKVVAYGKKDYTLANIRGVPTINGKAFSSMDPLHQAVALRVLSKLESKPMENEADLRRFVSQLAGKPKTYPLEGVLMELSTGDQIAVPFFMFSEKDLEVLSPGWEAWLRSEESSRSSEDLMMRSEAMAYQQAASQQAEHQQLELLKLNMLAARTGLTSFWEVQLQPRPGVYGRPTSVMVTARNSEIATQMVLSNYPGYSLIGVRRASY